MTSSRLFVSSAIFFCVSVLCLFISPALTLANTCQSNGTGGGNWGSASSWTSCGATTPQAADTATIVSGDIITLNTNATTTSVTINNGATLTEDGAGRSLALSGGWTNNGTFTATQSLIRLTATQTVTGGTSFNNLEFSPSSSATFTITAGTYATTTGTLKISGAGAAIFNTGNIDAMGDVTITNTGIGGGGSATLSLKGSGNQTLTGGGVANQGNLPNVGINKPSGNLTLSGLISVNGTAWTFTSIGTGSLITTGSTVYFMGNAGSTVVTGSHSLNNVTVGPTFGTRSLTISSGTTLTVTGTLSLVGAQSITVDTGTISLQGNLSLTNTSLGGGGTGTITVAGTGNQTITGPGTAGQSRLPNIVINRSSETAGTKLTLAGTISAAGDWTYTTGTVDATSSASKVVFFNAKSVNGGSMVFNNIEASSTRSLTGNLAVDGNVLIDPSSTLSNSSNFAISVGGNWTNNGSFTSGNATVTFVNPSTGANTSTVITGGTGTTQDFQNFTVNKSGGTVQLSTNGLDVDGNLAVSAGTLDLNGQNLTTTTSCSITSILKVLGSESVSCTPTFNTNSTFLLYGPGNATTSTYGTSFYNFTSATAGKNIIFPANTTTTIAGTLSLQGASGNTINLKSSASGTDGSKTSHQATISVATAGTLDYLTVYDNNAIGAGSPLLPTHGTDGGDNSGWFSGPPDTTPPTPGTVAFSNVTLTSLVASSTGAFDNVALAAVPFQYHNITSNTYSGATSTAWLVTGLTAGTSYSFEIGVEDAAGNWATTTSAATTTASLSPIGRWDVVPYQRINSGQTFNASVVAFSKPGIDHVTFTITGQGYADGPKTASSMSLNPQTGVWEYWVPISASEFTSDGPMTIEATVYGKDHGVRDKNTDGGGVGLDAFTLNVNPNGTLAQPQAWVDSAGSDTTGTVNDSSKPFATMGKAIAAIATANDGDAGGGIVRLNPGTYTMSRGGVNSVITTANEWVTVTTANGGTKSNTTLLTSQNTPEVKLLKLEGITVQSPAQYSWLYIPTPSNSQIWADQDNLIGAGQWVDGSYPINSASTYYTDSNVSYVDVGGPGALLARGMTIDHTGNDAFQNVPMVVNTTADDLDPGTTGNHVDAFQLQWVNAPTTINGNIIIYNYRANSDGQNIFVSDPPADPSFVIDGAAVVNSYFTSNLFGQWSVPTEHLVLWNNDIITPVEFIIRNGMKDMSVVGNVFSQLLTGGGTGAPPDFSDSHDNHFITGSTEGSNPTTGSADLDSTGRPNLTSPLRNRITPSLVPVDQSNLVRGTASDVGAYEYVPSHTIAASADSNGSISPSGSVSVSDGDNESFTITPNSGYYVSTLVVDSVSIATSTSYTFSDVTSDHSISTTFAPLVVPDTTPPSVSISAPSDSSTVSGSSVTLTATASDNVAVAGVQFKLDTNTNIGSEDTSAPYSVSWDSSGVAAGGHTLIAVARDTSGNYATSTPITVTVNNTPPVRSAGSPSGTLSSGTTGTTLSLNTNENATCKYDTTSIDYADMANTFSMTGGTSHSQTLSGLSDNSSYTYYVRCEDNQGNTNQDDYEISFFVANAGAPTVTMTAPSDSSTLHGSGITLSADASATDGIASVQFVLDSVTDIGSPLNSSPYTTTWDSTAVSDGPHQILAVALDTDGNYATSTAVSVTVDNTPPVLSLGSPAGLLAFNTASGTLSVTTNEAATCKYDTNSGTSYSSMGDTFQTTAGTTHTSPLTGLTNGSSYTYYARCEDSQGNIDQTDYAISFSIAQDTTPPVISSISASATQNTATITWTTDKPSTSQVAYGNTNSYGDTTDDSTLVTSHSQTLTNLAAGSTYHYQVISTDAYSNTATSNDETFMTSPTVTAGGGGGGYVAAYAPSATPAPVPAITPPPTVPPGCQPGYRFSTQTGEPCGTGTLPPSPPAVTPTPPATPPTFSRDLQLGSTGSDVMNLQRYLNAQGFLIAKAGAGSPGQETTTFGALTKAALVRFQKADHITPASGYFGPITRAYIARH